MLVLMQVLAGGFYLLQKVFLSIAERAERKNPNNKRWRVYAWSVYLAGLPAWTVIFVWEHNWIAAALEVSGAPAMILGLTIALRGSGGQKPGWLDRLAAVLIIAGIAYSLYDFGGITTVNQLLELGIIAGFLIGTYQLAHEKPSGYLWYLVMCTFNGALMWVQDYLWLAAQQVVSLGFIVDAYLAQRRRIRSA
jgi:hypothetical protein